MEEQDFKELLKRMGKREVVQLLENAEKENDSNRQQIRDLQNTVEQQGKQLAQAMLLQSAPGSLADSVAEANGVMLSAQNTANEYLAQIQTLMDLKKQEADGIVSAAKQEAAQIVAAAEQEKKRIENSCVDILNGLRRDADGILGKTSEDYSSGLSAKDAEIPAGGDGAAKEAPATEEENAALKLKMDKLFQTLVANSDQSQGAAAE